MNPIVVLVVIALYFMLLVSISYITSRKVSADSFFTGDKQSPWYVVAFGMIGASLSGITFVSVPGIVGNSNFYYFQIVLGYMAGYFVIATVLMPLYYRLNLVSIYSYLGDRFGIKSQKTGSSFFLLSQSIGASLRLYVVAGVLQLAFFDHFEIPFYVTVLLTIALIWVYTNKAGIKTIVWTDTLQTLFMLLSVIVSIFIIGGQMDLSILETFSTVKNHPYSDMFNWDSSSKNYFFKQFISGALIAIVMTGLDQNMMQKNLTCKNLPDAQKNVFWFSISIIFTNLLFLSLGVLLYVFAFQNNITIDQNTLGQFLNTDELYPKLALNYFGSFAAIVFLLGITAAAFSSADSALTSLTTAWCSDFIDFSSFGEKKKIKIRNQVHIIFSGVLMGIIMIFKWVNDESTINAVFTIAGYTYGPLLGLFSFGLFTTAKINDRLVPIVCLVTPFLSYAINLVFKFSFDFELGYTVLLINGLLTYFGLLMIRINN